MKSLNQHILEKLKIKKQVYTVTPASKEELVTAIKAAIDKNGNNCSLNHIDISKLDELDNLFADKLHGEETYDLENFDGDISKWNVSNITSMKNLFWCSKYSGKYGDISDWDVSSVEDMSGLFNNSHYNGDISDWNVSSVENMDCMFWGIGNEAENFDPEKFDLSKWDVSSVTDMSSMFAHSSFNSDISNWDVSSVESMNSMFMYSDFNQDISSWVISSDTDTNDMFDNCPLHDGGEFRDEWKPTVE